MKYIVASDNRLQVERAEYSKAIRQLEKLVNDNPSKLLYTDNTTGEAFTIVAWQDKLVTTVDSKKRRGLCGTLPLVRSIKTGGGTLTLQSKEITLK